MRPDNLLDAIGLLDDRFFEPEEKPSVVMWRRRSLVLVAAVLIVLLIGTAMAVSPQLRERLFSVFNIETREHPPGSNGHTRPEDDTPSGLREIDVVNIDGVVQAHYFTSKGFVRTCEGGFYTCSHVDGNTVPEDAAFWELRTEGIEEIDATRIDFPLTHGDRTFRIIFDYAILNGKLSMKVWPQNLDENPVGNGWHAEPIGDRTDIALVTVPVDIGTDYTHDFFVLDLVTLEMTDLLESIPHDNMVMDACRITDDLQYAILLSFDGEKGGYEYWFCDLERNTITTLDVLTETDVAEPYFLNESTIIFRESLGEGRFNLVSHHIPTGVQSVIIKNTTMRSGDNAGYQGIQKNGGNGTHCLLFREYGSVDLLDLRTGEALNMTGLNTDKLTTSESPDGTRVLIGYEETNEKGELGYGFSGLGLLDPETGVLQMLTRETSGNPESFWGWLDNDTFVITAWDDAGGYYVYVYTFQT